MAALLNGIRSGITGTFNTAHLAWNKLTTQLADSAAWQKTSTVAAPYIKQGISYYPDMAKFNFSKDFYAGATCTILFGIVYKKAHG